MKVKDLLFSKKYNSIYYFFMYKIPFVGKWNYWHNPLYHWWKMRKYFKFPKIHFVCQKDFWMFGCPINKNYYKPIVDIRFNALGWKDKYDSPRHEHDPFLQIVFFKKYHLVWVFNWITKGDFDESTRNMATWEALLDMMFYKHTITEVRNMHIWSSNENKIYIDSNLTKYALNEIAKNS